MKSNCGIFRAWAVEKVKLERGERQTGNEHGDSRHSKVGWVWLSYWTLTVKPRGQTYSAGEVLVRLQAPIDH
jgi:hypothetical protein